MVLNNFIFLFNEIAPILMEDAKKFHSSLNSFKCFKLFFKRLHKISRKSKIDSDVLNEMQQYVF